MKGNQLSYEDPWSTAPAQPEPTPEPTPAPVVTTASSAAVDSVSVQHSTDGVSATFKFAGAYSDPWVVVKGADPSDVLSKIETPEFKALMDKVQLIAGHYAGPGTKPAGNAGGGAQAQQSRAPQAAQEAPGGEERYCQHGKMEFKSGVSKKTGKPYKLFSCTAPRDQQCEAQFLNDKK
ncbi:DNA binding protein [Mycobacterium phage ArcherNM]|uniref:ribonucleoside reductase class II n=1 Tax=Mycobacterium phage ArcherNM TaxID=1815972 RepID=UPI00078B9E7D|nr:ribonucleoside reductase class II [Mycobacterium phage ArcherNM]AMS01039.1 DNA binding protein [Mycobacterium phage ArcherNM]